MCISGIDYAQKLDPESGSHDEEPYVRLLGVRHIQTRRCVRITDGSRQRRRAGMQIHVSVYPLTAHQPSAGTWRDMRRGTPCRADTDNWARPRLTSKSVLP
jgi:hypothetical protein